MKNNRLHTPAFSIIEVLIGIFVFSLGLVSIYALLASSLSINSLNQNSIIASNLAREQLELMRNIRDTNYKNLKVYNQQDPAADFNLDETSLFQVWKFYTLENNLSSGNIDVETIESPVWKEISEIFWSNRAFGRLCFDDKNRYVYCSGWWDTSSFLRYIEVTQVQDEWWALIEDALLITSRVSWYQRGYHEYEVRTILTDWRRI